MNIIRIICLPVFFCLLYTAQRLNAQCNLSLSAQVNAISCFGGENGSIDLTVAGGTAPYTYLWSNGLEDEDIFGLSAGTYRVTVTDDAGCTATLVRPVTELPPLNVTVQTNNINCLQTGVDIHALASGGTAPYLYIWSNGATGASIPVVAEAQYVVTVIDGNSCTATASGYVDVDTIPPGADAGPDQALNCTTPTVTLGGPGTSTGSNFAYHWSGPGINQGNMNALNPVVNQPGVYWLLVFGFSNVCENTDVVIVSGSPAPTADAGPDTGIPCGGGTVQLNGNGSSTGAAISYLWTTTDGNIVSGANTLTPIVDEPGIYQLEVIDNAYNCSRTDLVRVYPGPVIPDTDYLVVEASCETQQGSILLGNISMGQAPYTHVWSNGATTANLIYVPAGTYQVVVTDALNCMYFADIVIGLQQSSMTLTLDVTPAACNNVNNGAINLTVNGGTGPFEYFWSMGNTTQDVSNLQPGTYTVTVEESNGCRVVGSAMVPAQAGITLAFGTTNQNSCIGSLGTIDVTATGGTGLLGYNWAHIPGANNPEDPTNLSAGVYTVTVTDAIGCTASGSATVGDVQFSLSLSATTSSASCLTGTGGAVDLSVSGGAATAYLWNDGATTEDISGLLPGTYITTVTDVNNCTATLSVTVTTGGEMPAASFDVTPAACETGAANGAIQVNILPADVQAPLDFFWEGPGGFTATQQDIFNIISGAYSLTLSDATGCTYTATVVVGQLPSSIQLTASVSDALCSTGNSGSVDLTASGGVPDYTYNWSNGATTEDLLNVNAATYTCTVTDATGCTRVLEASVGSPAAVVITAQVTNAICSSNTGSIDLVISGGMGNYTFNWSNSANTEDLLNLAAGIYTVTVTDPNNCSATSSVTVQQAPSPLFINGLVSHVSCNGGNNGSIDVTVTGGLSPYDFIWVGGETVEDLTGLSAGVYTVQVSDQNGCTATRSWNISQPAPLIISITINNVSCNGAANGALVLTAAGGAGQNTFLWSNGQTVQSPNNLPAGSYCVTVTDLNACTVTDCATITQPANLQFDILSLSNDCNSATISGPVSPGLIYNWSGPNGFISMQAVVSVSTGGVYTLTITDFNGCTATDSYQVVVSGNSDCGKVGGKVFFDTTENCAFDTGESGLSGWLVRAEGVNDTLYGVTNAQGEYLVSVPLGDYTMRTLVPNGLWALCPVGGIVSVNTPNVVVPGGDLPVQALYQCPSLSINIGTNQLRRCFSNNNYTVQYCNNGTASAEDALVTVVLDPFLTLQNASLPFFNLGSNTFRFEVGDLAIGQCGSFNFNVYVSCNAMLGQTHCTGAYIYPDTTCLPRHPDWSGASLQLRSECEADSLRFIVKNTGFGPTNEVLEYIVVEDAVMRMMAPLPPLESNDSTTIAFPANGSTWRIEVEQASFHPYDVPVGLSVEGCSNNAAFSTGFVNQFSPPDAPETVDIDCRANIGAYDPNDKQGYPEGYGTAHYVRPGTEIEYLIRFQNTGTDTAFTVRIADTLSSWLDPATIRLGAVSHPGRFDLHGSGILEILFENILLPDSNTNEPASHGFAKFSIRPRSDAPLETLIENTAAIYFDFNEPIITNTTYHRLGENFVTVGTWQALIPEAEISIAPNPFSDQALLQLKGLTKNGDYRLQVMDLQGNVRQTLHSVDGVFRLQRGNWPAGMYLFHITLNGRPAASGKLVVE
jgi:uncharacterized repeat protein (TIGR01451 family)